jgi:hypothetical protein
MKMNGQSRAMDVLGKRNWRSFRRDAEGQYATARLSPANLCARFAGIFKLFSKAFSKDLPNISTILE